MFSLLKIQETIILHVVTKQLFVSYLQTRALYALVYIIPTGRCGRVVEAID